MQITIGTHRDDPVYGITTAEQSHSADIAKRQKQYILTMLFRVVSVVIIVWVPGIGWPVKIVLAVVASIIPYVAVVRANGGPAPAKDPTNMLVGPPEKGVIGGASRGLADGGEPGGDGRESSRPDEASQSPKTGANRN